MRQVTTTAVRFEGIPCYIIALQLVICAVIVVLLSRPRFQQETTALRFAGAIFGVSLCLCVIAIVMLFWMAEKHDSLTFCIFDGVRRTCACRADNRTKASTGWVLFEEVDSCRILDSLFRMMIATMIVYAVAAFCCALALMLVYSIALNGRGPLSHAPPSNGGGYYDWDSWLRSTDNLQRLMTAMRNGWFPPSYDTSQRETRRQMRRIRDRQRIFSVTAEPPPPYSPSSLNSPSSNNPSAADFKPSTPNVTTIELL
uniref:Uncharacterized protein n=1 Tax=Plectus sambesii TaxID=2011161 RepID=A0A914VL52_9BILA